MFQCLQCIVFFLAGGYRRGFPEDKIVAEIGFITQSLIFCFWFEAFVMAFLRIERTVETDMQVPATFWAGQFPREISVNMNLFATQNTCFHLTLPFDSPLTSERSERGMFYNSEKKNSST